MATPTQKFEEQLKRFFKWLSDKPYAIPVVLALTCGVYYLTLEFLSTVCFGNLLAPLFMLGMLWGVGVRSIKKLLIVGLVAAALFSAVMTAYIVNYYQHVEPRDALSEDGSTMVGTVSPWYGSEQTTFSFNLTVTLTNSSQTVTQANVLIYQVGTGDSVDGNYTMMLVDESSTATSHIYNYTYVTLLPLPINQFLFRANISGDWVSAGDYDEVGRLSYIQGPVFSDPWAVALTVIPWAIMSSYLYVFGPYAILVAMIWWTRRARKMRQDQLERWEKERAKEEAEKPKETSKVPSLDAAMGKVEEGFVCSECGADVPADAQVCPKCGEKFD